MALPDPVGWPLTVAAASNVTPQMRRIELSNPALAAFDYLPGQDMALAFSKDDGTTVRRRYTIRRFDRNRASLMIDVVLHGDGPGMRWARAARPGISIDAIGPRGKITLVDDAEWHHLAGEVALVSALKAALLNRGWDAEQISAKAYWNRGRANAGHGEPELKAS